MKGAHIRIVPNTAGAMETLESTLQALPRTSLLAGSGGEGCGGGKEGAGFGERGVHRTEGGSGGDDDGIEEA